tara:strand:+ start:1535 stop:1903 length:369 start_codon:yes stop_codon:yes gene_type:complete
MNVYYILFLTQNIEGLKKGYIPSGLTEKQWSEIKIKEQNSKPKNYAQSGITRGFRSRSLNDFLELKEKGKADYNMPVFNAKEKLEKGIIQEKDIPYMQRKNGKPDDSDISAWNIFLQIFRNN